MEILAFEKKQRKYQIWGGVGLSTLATNIGSNQFGAKEFRSGLRTMEIYDTDNVFEFDF